MVYVPPRETHVLENIVRHRARRVRGRAGLAAPRTRSSSPGPSRTVTAPESGRSPAPAGVEIFWRWWLPDGDTDGGGGDRARRRRAQRALRARRRPADAGRLRGVRARPSRPRALGGSARADRPDRQRRRRSRQADRACGAVEASRRTAVHARPQHGRHGRGALRARASGPAVGSDPVAGRWRRSTPVGRRLRLVGDALSALAPDAAAGRNRLVAGQPRSRRSSRTTAATRSCTTASSRRAPWPSSPPQSSAFPDRVGAITVPTLILYGTEDRSVPAARERDAGGAHRRNGQARSRSYEGLYHEILNEPEREQVLDDICAWLAARVGATVA